MHNVNFPPDKGKPKRGILNKKKECLSNLQKKQGEKYEFVRIKTHKKDRRADSVALPQNKNNNVFYSRTTIS